MTDKGIRDWLRLFQALVNLDIAHFCSERRLRRLQSFRSQRNVKQYFLPIVDVVWNG